MSTRRLRLPVIGALFGILLLGAEVGAAQNRSFSASAGVFSFDLSGTGNAPSVAIALDWAGEGAWILEGGATFAFPEQQFGDRTTLVIPEAVVQHQWRLGRWAPFAGGGVGVAIDIRDSRFGGAQTDLALSGGGGFRVDVSDSMGVRTDFRLRGFGANFVGSAAELRAGVFLRF